MALDTAISRARLRGFSTLELVVAVAIITIMAGVAVPSLVKTYKVYEVNNAANQLAGILKLTRSDAIRRNSPTPLQCVNTQSGTDASASIWADENGDLVAQPTEPQILLSSGATLVAGNRVPGRGSLPKAVGATALKEVNEASGSVAFDARGAVIPASVYVYYVGNSQNPSWGYRAVVLLPSGAIQVWTYASGTTNTWQRIS